MPALFRTTVASPGAATVGDRNLIARRVYPPAMLHTSGGRVIDVTQAPYGAKNDGTDAAGTTAAIKAAYNFIVDLLRANPRNTPSTSYILYFPAGTYLVNDTLGWDGDYTAENSDVVGEMENHQYIRFIGEERTTTTIKLADNSPGFGESATYGVNPFKPVVTFLKNAVSNKLAFNNLETKSTVRGLTIDTGKRNPGAVGINYVGANANELCDLTVRSGDGTGKAGIFFCGSSLTWTHDVTIEGFNYGIDSAHIGETLQTLEHVTVRDQLLAGVHALDSNYTIRDLLSDNSVPAVDCAGRGAFLAIIDSTLVGGASANAAIRFHNDGACFARGISTSGYGTAITRGTTAVAAGPTITEYKSAALSVHGGVSNSMPLPVEEVPTVDWPDVDGWEVVTTNSNEAAQAALNSGKPGVMFKGHTFSIGSVTVPASVKRVNFAFSRVSGTFNLGTPSTDPILFEDGEGFIINQNGKSRTVIMTATFLAARYRNTTPKLTDKVFLNCTSSMQNESGTFILRALKMWGRCVNDEPKNLVETPIDLACFDFQDGAQVWILGGKTESNSNGIGTLNGVKLEVIGFYFNQTVFEGAMGALPRTTSVCLRMTDSQVSFSGYTDGHNNPGYRDQIRATKAGTTINTPYTVYPKRYGKPYNCFFPLYVDQLL
ncbi:MAG: glycosyl hydrolase family 28-related protein [Rhodospirillales bacterium]